MYNMLEGLLVFRRGIKDSFHLSLKTGLHLQQLGDSVLIWYFFLFRAHYIAFVFSAALVTVENLINTELLGLTSCT